MKKLWMWIDYVGKDPWYVWWIILPIGGLAFLSAVVAFLRPFLRENFPGIWNIGIILLVYIMLSYGGYLIVWTIASMLRSVWHDPGESTNSVSISDRNEVHSAKAQAVTILGIATAALGFGLFTSELHPNSVSEVICSPSIVPQLQLTAHFFGISFYFATMKSVQVVLMQDSVTWRDVARRPLMGMGLIMMYLIVALVIDLFAA